ncbi:MAG: hypothetical protein KDB27_13800 [Planctomycetales bacterium]|nr:hypothetical protein [Planctomycetales bacterium]
MSDFLHVPVGDANLSGVFNGSDLIEIFTAAEYDDEIPGNSSRAEGDWNCDAEFDSSDLLRAFQAGRYSRASRQSQEVAAARSTIIGHELETERPAAGRSA